MALVHNKTQLSSHVQYLQKKKGLQNLILFSGTKLLADRINLNHILFIKLMG